MTINDNQDYFRFKNEYANKEFAHEKLLSLAQLAYGGVESVLAEFPEAFSEDELRVMVNYVARNRLKATDYAELSVIETFDLLVSRVSPEDLMEEMVEGFYNTYYSMKEQIREIYKSLDFEDHFEFSEDMGGFEYVDELDINEFFGE